MFLVCLQRLAVLFAFGQAHAAIIINEVSLNNESGDNGEEFFELLSDTGGAEAMTGANSFDHRRRWWCQGLHRQGFGRQQLFNRLQWAFPVAR